MRLSCPNCDAQYAVPDEVMPVEGRDVQCSNCGQTWFQHHPDFPSAEADSTDSAPPEPEAPAAEEQEAEIQQAEPELEQEPEPEPEPERPAEALRRELDPSVANILKEEAALETRRRQDAETLESQPDLGLEETDQAAPPPQARTEAEERAAQAKQRMARMRGETAAGMGANSRRELLPDIEEINSTLRGETASASSPAAAAPPTPQMERASRGRGFILTVALFAVLALLYVFAPQIAETVPALETAMTSYVGMVDQMRVALNGHLAALMAWLEDAASQSGA